MSNGHGGKREGAGRPQVERVPNPAIAYALRVLADRFAPAERRDAMATALLRLGPTVDAKLIAEAQEE